MEDREKSSSCESYWCRPAAVARVGEYLKNTSSKYRSASAARSASSALRLGCALEHAERTSAAANPERKLFGMRGRYRTPGRIDRRKQRYEADEDQLAELQCVFHIESAGRRAYIDASHAVTQRRRGRGSSQAARLPLAAEAICGAGDSGYASSPGRSRPSHEGNHDQDRQPRSRV